MGTKSKLTMTGLVGAVAAALVLSAGPASADPSPNTFPSLAGTGSDTTQFVLGGLSGAVPAIGSYDAIPAGLVQTRSDGPQFNRPNGSGAGVRALTASINPTGTYTWPQTVGGVTTQVSIAGQLDFARSSSGPSVTGSDLTYIPFATDAVSYSYSDFGPASVPSALTVADLTAIYLGDVTTYTDAAGVTREYTPLLPQKNSGTRAFFLKALGLSEAQVAWNLSSAVQENDGSQVDAIGEIAPFSVASWIAQTNNVAPNTIDENAVVLGAIDDDVLGFVAPVDGGVLNPAFPINRPVFNVVETARLTTTGVPADTLLQDTFKGAASDVCESDSVITQYGFGTIDNCGDTTSYKSGYVAP